MIDGVSRFVIIFEFKKKVQKKPFSGKLFKEY